MMNTKKYILKTFNDVGELTEFKRVEETYTDDRELYKWRVEDHLRKMINEGENQLDSNGYITHRSNEIFTIRTEKDEQGRFTLIELTYRKEPQKVYRSTTLSYYPDGRLYQKIEETPSYREENTYTYFGVVTQIKSVMQYKEGIEEDFLNDEEFKDDDYREMIWDDPNRMLIKRYDIVTNRLTKREVLCHKRMYHYSENYDEDGTTHTFCLKEKKMSEHENHVLEYNDGVLTSDEIQLGFFSEDKKKMWFMQQTINYEEKTQKLDRLGYIKLLDDSLCDIHTPYSLY